MPDRHVRAAHLLALATVSLVNNAYAAQAGPLLSVPPPARDAAPAQLKPPPSSITSSNTLSTALPRTGWFIDPYLTVSATYTDNIALAPAEGRESGFITTIAPGVRVEGIGARSDVRLHYQRNELFYSKGSGGSESQNFLDALLATEAIERRLLFDASATITQQSISAFGSQTSVTENVNNNRTETRTFSASPRLIGQIGPGADYEVRYRYGLRNSSGTSAGDAEFNEWTAVLKSSNQFAIVSWAIDAQNQIDDVEGRDALEARRVRGTVFYRFDVSAALLLTGGYEASNYDTPDMESNPTYGIGFEWLPTPRTRFSGLAEHRFFGTAHVFLFSHRTALSAWQYVDTRGVSTSITELQGGRGIAFDLLSDALAGQMPDRRAREREVEQRLRRSGIPSNLGISSGFVTGRPNIEHARRASVALLGLRNTLTFTAGMTKRSALGPGGAIPDDFTLSPQIEQRSFGGSWAHRLSGRSTLNFLASHTKSEGVSSSNLDSSQSLFRLLLTRQMTPRTWASLGIRHVRFEGASTSSYTENAITATISTTF